MQVVFFAVSFRKGKGINFHVFQSVFYKNVYLDNIVFIIHVDDIHLTRALLECL